MLNSKSDCIVCNAEANPATVKKVKEAVDFIYEATQGSGTPGGWNKYPARVRASVSIMVKRGILVKEGHPKQPIYRWAVASAPTKTLYQSIANEIVMKERASNQNHRARKRAEKTAQEAPEVKTEPIIAQAPSAAPTAKQNPVLAIFSDQALWDELKRRGYVAEGDRLVFKKYLD